VCGHRTLPPLPPRNTWEALLKPGSLNHLIDINHFRSETVVDAKCRADNGVKEAWKWESTFAKIW
jgi:hypothetical protein